MSKDVPKDVVWLIPEEDLNMLIIILDDASLLLNRWRGRKDFLNLRKSNKR